MTAAYVLLSAISLDTPNHSLLRNLTSDAVKTEHIHKGLHQTVARSQVSLFTPQSTHSFHKP